MAVEGRQRPVDGGGDGDEVGGYVSIWSAVRFLICTRSRIDLSSSTVLRVASESHRIASSDRNSFQFGAGGVLSMRSAVISMRGRLRRKNAVTSA